MITQEGKDPHHRVLKNHIDQSDIKLVLDEVRKLQKTFELQYSRDDFEPMDGQDRCADSGAFESWYGIKETDVIQGAYDGREEKDERHICPLQLETIRRCIQLWSNPNEIVLDPFNGVGSTGFVALDNDRKYIGIELKESWYRQSIVNINRLFQPQQLEMF